MAAVLPTGADSVTIQDTHAVTVRNKTTNEVGSLTVAAGGAQRSRRQRLRR